MSVANSIQEPLKGITLAEYNFVPFACDFDQRRHQVIYVIEKQ